MKPTIEILAQNEKVTVLQVKKTLDQNCVDEIQRINFLDFVMNLIAKDYPYLPATYYEERHKDTLDVVVVIRNHTV